MTADRIISAPAEILREVEASRVVNEGSLCVVCRIRTVPIQNTSRTCEFCIRERSEV